jgi:beta-lactamase regulating signal transducer with metallopeptidase domain
MIGEFANHLWQSTVFAGAAALLALACRKNEARVRYWLWLAASLKFLVPIALLVALGSRLEWAPVAQQIAPAALSSAVVQLSQPFVDLAPASDRSVSSMRSGAELFTTALCALWVSGVVAIALIRLRMWRRVRAVARASTPRHVPGIPAEIEVRSAPGLMEPGVVGVCPSILLIPAGIEDHLTPRQVSDDGVKFKQTSNSEQPVGPPPPGAVIGGGLLRL